MPYDENLAERVRSVLAKRNDIREQKMFGGLSFMLNGNMCCGVLKDVLVIRTEPEQALVLLDKPGVKPMDFTGKPLKGFLYIAQDVCQTKAQLAKWVGLATNFASNLPKKY